MSHFVAVHNDDGDHFQITFRSTRSEIEAITEDANPPDLKIQLCSNVGAAVELMFQEIGNGGCYLDIDWGDEMGDEELGAFFRQLASKLPEAQIVSFGY